MMKKILNIVLLMAVSVAVMAKPAYRGPIVRTAADGTEKIVYLHGNEHFHYMTDEQGNWLDERSLEPLSEERKAERQHAGMARVAKEEQQTEVIGESLNLAPRGLLILVNFQNVSFRTPVDTIKNMINGDNFTRSYSYTYGKNRYVINSSGSARKYFKDQSFGQYNPTFDVVGPVTVSKNMAYYGENDKQGYDKRPTEMIKEACLLANADGVDFTKYDNDNDGKVDFVYVIYAGFGEADGGADSTIWPHSYDLYTYGRVRCNVDGKLVDRYACGCEMSYMSKKYDGIGTFCHEFSHVMGIPDLYSTDDKTTHKTMGAWDIMDYGPYNNDGNTPPSYSAYERFFFGWMTPRLLKESKTDVTLKNLNTARDAIMLCKGEPNMVGTNPNPTTFYMLENRQKTGWDEFLPGEGMLLTKVSYDHDKWVWNKINNDPNDMGVDLIEADGQAPTYVRGSNNGHHGKEGDAYPAGASYWRNADWALTGIRLDGSHIIHFDYTQLTPIEQVQDGNEAEVRKIMRNGQLLIVRDGKEYDLWGRRTTAL